MSARSAVDQTRYPVGFSRGGNVFGALPVQFATSRDESLGNRGGDFVSEPTPAGDKPAVKLATRRAPKTASTGWRFRTARHSIQVRSIVSVPYGPELAGIEGDLGDNPHMLHEACQCQLAVRERDQLRLGLNPAHG